MAPQPHHDTPSVPGPRPSQTERLRRATARFVPTRLVELLGVKDVLGLELGLATERKMTVLFSDICGFTPLAEVMSPADTFRFINSYLAAIEPVVEENGGFVDKYVGDGLMALFPTSADDALSAAVGMLAALEKFNATRGREERPVVRIGVGLNTGMMAVGIVGSRTRLEGTVVSDAVNLASRLETLTRHYGTPLLIGEQTLYALTEARWRPVRYLDRIRVKGKTQPQSIHEVYAADPPALRAAKERTTPLFEQAVAWYHLKEIDRAEPLLRECLEAAPADAPARLYLERCQAFRERGHHEGTGELEGTLEWRPEFQLGLDVVDGQHRELLRQMNAFALRLRSGDSEGLAPMMDFLGRYVVDHFGTEEALMSERGYPFANVHWLEHRNFEAFYERLCREIDCGTNAPLFLVFRAQVFLLDWFTTHILGTDRHMARWLAAH